MMKVFPSKIETLLNIIFSFLRMTPDPTVSPLSEDDGRKDGKAEAWRAEPVCPTFRTTACRLAGPAPFRHF